MKGGYKIVSFKNLDLTTENGVIVDGVYQAIANPFKKQLMLADVNIKGETQTECFVIAEYNETSKEYLIYVFNGVIIVKENDKVEFANVKYVESDDIQTLSNEILNSLKAGDVVVKITDEQKHSYRVSYKEDYKGLCLTYSDASVVETISYDCTDGEWIYNSTDVTNIWR